MSVSPLIGEVTSSGAPALPHPLLDALFTALDGDGVRWCLLRGEGKLHAPDGDIDMLVARAHLDRVWRIAADLGFTHIPAWGYGSHVSFLAYHEPTDSWIKLDFVTDLAYGPGFSLATGAQEACLDRRRRRGPVAVLADEDAFWCLLLHLLLDKGKIREAEAARLGRLASAPCERSPLARVVESVAPPQWTAQRIVEAARAGDWSTLVALGGMLAGRWSRSHPATVWRRRISNEAWRWTGRVLRTRRRRGVAVRLLGPERDATAAALARSFYFPVRVVAAGDGASIERWAREGQMRYHRARGRLVLLEGGPSGPQRGHPVPDLTAVADGDADRARREITAAVWQAYRRGWSGGAAPPSR